MEIFTDIDISQFTTVFLIVGAILFVLGFLLRGNAKKSSVSSVISMLFLTVGSILLLLAAFKWISQSFNDWGIFSDRML